MARYQAARVAKATRNLIYARKYAQSTCIDCAHKQSDRGRCHLCMGLTKLPYCLREA